MTDISSLLGAPIVPRTRKHEGPLRVLVAEDNDLNRTMIDILLRRMGLEPTTVTNGREAVEAVDTQDFDVVLMDIQMPEMDGPTALKAIRALEGDKAHIPVVVLTGGNIAEERDVYIEAGFNAFLSKPIERENLAAVLAVLNGG